MTAPTLADGMTTSTCAGDLEGCPEAPVSTYRGWAWHPERVRCRACGIATRWAAWRPRAGAHYCLACDLQSDGAWT